MTQPRIKLCDYQKFAISVAADPRPTYGQFLNYSLGIKGEFGEVADCLKKVIGQGHPYETMREKLIKELGDCLWYPAMLLYILGHNFNDIFSCEYFDEIVPTSQLRGAPQVYTAAEYLLKNNSAQNIADAVLAILPAVQAGGQYDTQPVTLHIMGFLCHIASIASMLEIDLNEAAQRNIDKLTKRFTNKNGEVVFTVEASLNRKE